jgi:two-component system OmpR family response regulator
VPDRLAVVEDDPDQRALLARGLQQRGFAVEAYGDRPAALRAFSSGAIPDLAILDVNLNGDDQEDRDGFTLCRELLEIPGGDQVPVIFLTHLEDHRDQMTGSSLAVAYMQKPPDLELLAARVHGLLAWSRRLYGPEPSVERTRSCGDLQVDFGANRAHWKGRDLELTYTEFEILRVLTDQPGRVATHQDVCDAIGAEVTNNTIATHVQHIRGKFSGADPGFPRTQVIRAVPRRGYAWETPPDDA